MGEPIVILRLKAKRAEIVREIDRLQATLAAHGADLLHIEAAIAICAGKPLYEPQRRKRLFQRGELGKLVFAALRRSERPLSTVEIIALVSPDAERKAALKSVGKWAKRRQPRAHVFVASAARGQTLRFAHPTRHRFRRPYPGVGGTWTQGSSLYSYVWHSPRPHWRTTETRLIVRMTMT